MAPRRRFYVLLGLLLLVVAATGAVILLHPAEKTLPRRLSRTELVEEWDRSIDELMLRRDFAAAETLVLRLRHFRPRDPRPALLLGRIRYETGRYAEAAALLKYTGLPVKEIAARTGFSDVAHFSRRIKAWSGRSPGELRHSPDNGE